MRFKFKLKDEDNSDFNYELVVDVMNLRCGSTNKNVLHAVDTVTGFQAVRFLPLMSVKDTWQTLRMAWIDTYLRPPDIITYHTMLAPTLLLQSLKLKYECHEVTALNKHVTRSRGG